MHSSYLSSGKINIELIKEYARNKLHEIFQKYNGSKAIIWDDKLVGSFGLLADYPFLQQRGVTQMFPFRNGRLPEITADHVIYIIQPKLSHMNTIKDNIKHEEEKKVSKKKKEFHILFMPQKSVNCLRKLEDIGVYGNFTSIDEYPIELYPLDSDVISMELDCCFKEIYLENDISSMFHVAKGIMTIQSLFGIIPNVYGVGKCSKQVWDLIIRMRRELGGKEAQVTPQIDYLLLLDRSVDLLSPFVTQLTYEGLLDEIYGIHNNSVKLPPEKFLVTENNQRNRQNDPPTELKQITLNSSEELFIKLRDKNFNAVGPTLSKAAKNLTAQFDERLHAKTVSDLKQFVERMPRLQTARMSQSIHTSIAELIKASIDNESFRETIHIEQDFVNSIDADKSNTYIEDCIAKQDPIFKVLRLICIQSLVNNGLKPKILDFYKREIVQTYGYNHIVTLYNLEKAGILKSSTGYGSKIYNTIRKTLRLTIEDVDEQNPTDAAYVHSGYAPLSIRLAQFLVQPGWRSISDVLKLLPEPFFDDIQQIPMGLRKRRNSGSSINSTIIDEPKVILVFFIGGATYAEISALRFLSQQEELNVEFVVATTKIINGKTFIESLL